MKYLYICIISLCFLTSAHAQYYHQFQNFDDDVDRVKTYSNFFGGNYGYSHEDSLNPQIYTSYDTIETRTGYGRSLKIDYGPLDSLSMYTESFDRKWGDRETSFNLTNLFPDYTNPQFQGRCIDSLVFYCKLIADSSLTLKLELHDANTEEGKSYFSFDINPSAEWQRVAIALNQFTGNFDPSRAKFLGLTFADFPNNQNESGNFYVDDFYLVEAGFTKPIFPDDIEMLDYLNKVNFRHIWMAVDPISKFALDRHVWNDLISVDAIGFQLSAYVIAHRHEWINRALIENRVEHILDYLLHHCLHATDTSQVQSDPLGYATVNGIWSHFLDYNTLSRKNIKTEFSLFTNALLLTGVLVCKEYFEWNSNIMNWADSLYRMADWNFLYRSHDSLMYYSWTPENGFSQYCTDWFTEELDLAFLLAISTPDTNHRVPANPFLASGYRKPLCEFWQTGNYIYSAPGANFTYYFMQMYARYPLENKLSLSRFDNARNALLADLTFCRQEYCCLNYDQRIFGTTACEGPDSAGIDNVGNNISNYHAYGYPCRHDTTNVPNGTIAVYGSGAATLFIPAEAIACLKYYYYELDTLFMNKYGYSFWSPIFGFPDAFHLCPDLCNDPDVNNLKFRGPWLSVPRFGIDIGPMLMNIDSYISESRSDTSIRDLFSRNAYIEPNLDIFAPIPVGITPCIEHKREYQLFQNYPNPFNPMTYISFDLPKSSHVRITLYNILGEQVAVLLDELREPGYHLLNFDASKFPSGIYFYRINTGKFQDVKKMLLIK